MGFLTFRAGRADETLPWSGVSHLVEHLALPTDHPRSLEFNGVVDAITTSFWCFGPRARVLEFQAALGSSLAALPLERLETERRILLTEASRAETHPVQGALNLRYGAQGPGVGGLDELGLRRLSGEDVARWANERFTRGNAVAFLTGEPPEAFDWGLPPGDRVAPVEPRAIPYLELPSVHVGGTSGVVVLAFVAHRSTALRAVTSIVERRARQRLRYALGVTYEVSWSYEPLSRDLAHVTVWADSLPANATQVTRELVAVLDELATAGPTDEELERALDDEREWYADPENVASNLGYRALQDLLGDPFQTDEELLDELAAVTPSAAAASLASGLETALLVVPEDARVTDRRFTPYPIFSPERVSGRAHALRGLNLSRDARRTRLVVGEDGVSLVRPDEKALTVRFDDCVALERWTSGDRALWGADGFRVEVVPEAWRGGEAAVRTIDERVPPELVVPMDREIEERTAEVGAVAETRVKRGWMTSDELDLLPGVLAPGEHVVTLAQGSKGWRLGMVALTDRRLLFLYVDDLIEETDLGSISAVEIVPETWRSTAALAVTTPSGELRYTDIKEDGLAELAAELRARTRAAD